MSCERLPYIPDLPDDDLVLMHHFQVSETYPLHTHEFYEIFYVVRGQAIHEINSVTQVVGEGALVFIRPDDVHCYQHFNLMEFEMININIADRLHTDAFAWLRIPREVFDSPRLPPSVQLTGAVHMEMRRKFLALSEMPPGENRRRAFCALLPEVLMLLFGHRDTEPTQYMPRWMSDIIKRMDQPECFTKGLPELLRMTTYTQEHLTRCFRKYMHLSPTAYINQKRLNYAAELLTTDNLTPQQAAAEAGFHNISHFYHLFREQYSCTPLQFSQQYRDQQALQARHLLRIGRRALHRCTNASARRITLEDGLFAYYTQDGKAHIYISFAHDATERSLTELTACWDPHITPGATVHANRSNYLLLKHLCGKYHTRPVVQNCEPTLTREKLQQLPDLSTAAQPGLSLQSDPAAAVPQLMALLTAAAPSLLQKNVQTLHAHLKTCAESGCFFLLMQNGAPVGAAWGIEDEIESIAVHPAHRRKGFGTLLAAECARDLLTRSDACTICLPDTEAHALSFFQSAGFVQTACDAVFHL